MPALDESALAVLGLVGCRLLPLGLLVAFASRQLVPPVVGLSLVLALGVALAPGAGSAAGLGLVALVACALRELALGLAFAVVLLLPLLALGWAARLGEHVALASPGRAGPIATLYGLTAVLVFFALSGHRAWVMALSASFVDVPVGAASLDRTAFALGLARSVVDGFAYAFAWGLPLVASLWIASAALALVARAFGAHVRSESMARPLLVLLAALLLAPLSARVPVAVRTSLDAARALVRDASR